jgi:large subunit ribosomal protein L7/L12
MIEKIDTILNLLKTLTLLEVVSLIKAIETTFNLEKGITLSQPQIITTTPSISAHEVQEEKNTFEITLSEVPADKKIAILKIVRTVTGLGLKESKDLVDTVPKIIKEMASKEEVDKIKKEIESFGGKVSIK